MEARYSGVELISDRAKESGGRPRQLVLRVLIRCRVSRVEATRRVNRRDGGVARSRWPGNGPRPFECRLPCVTGDEQVERFRRKKKENESCKSLDSDAIERVRCDFEVRQSHLHFFFVRIEVSHNAGARDTEPHSGAHAAHGRLRRTRRQVPIGSLLFPPGAKM
jgi:hypothetical protein